MKKWLVPLLLALLMSSTALADHQWSNDAGEHFQYEVTNGYAILTGYIVDGETPEEILIPDTIDGLPLREIGSGALNNWTFAYDGEAVLHIVIPEGVTALRDGAFLCCHDVPCIQLPSTLEIIETGGTFSHVCAELVFPNGNPSFTMENGFLDQRTCALLYCAPSASEHELPAVHRIEDSALDNYRRSATQLIFPDGVEYIGSYNAYDRTQLERIVVPGSVLELGEQALCINSATEIVLHEGLRRIGSEALAHTNIQSITVPSTVEWIAYDAFGSLDAEDVILLNPNCVWEGGEEY